MTEEPDSPMFSALESEEEDVQCYDDWKEEVRNGGSLKEVSLETGTHGWASPAGNTFLVRGPNYFSRKVKEPSTDSMLKPLGVDWLRSHSKLDHVLSRSDNRVMKALAKAQHEGKGLKSFIFAVNLQVPGREHHSAVFYYVTEDPIPPGSLLYRFIHEEDDAFRNSRFKLINRIVKGPWIVKATVGNHAACLLGKALTCHYIRRPNYLEIDVDIGSSTVANYILHLALGYVNSVIVDMAFLVESQSEEELPERLLGTVRIAQIDMESAVLVEPQSEAEKVFAMTPNGGTHGHTFQASMSWKRFSRTFSFIGHSSKAGKVDAEQDR